MLPHLEAYGLARIGADGSQEGSRRVRRPQQVQALLTSSRRGGPAGALGSVRQEPGLGSLRAHPAGHGQVYRVRLQKAEEVGAPKNRPDHGRLYLKVDVYRFILLHMNRAVTLLVKMTLDSGFATPGEWRIRARNGRPGDGAPNAVNLTRYAREFELSTHADGVNAHIGPRRVLRASIVRQETGEVIAAI